MIERIAFLGTPEISGATLRFLVESGYHIPLVVTGADKRRGRGSQLTPSPVAALATELKIPVFHDPKVLADTDFDLAVVVAYGRLIPESLLQKGLFVNLHFSLLPRWRGAAPMERAILEGDTETGICVMKLVNELDAGPIFQSRSVELDDTITLKELASLLSDLANSALGDELARGESAFSQAREQVGTPSYAHKLTAEDLRIDWNATSQAVLRRVRLGRAWTTLRGRRFRILGALDKGGLPPVSPPGRALGTIVGTGDGCIELVAVQPENKRVMDAQSWRNGIGRSEDVCFE